MRAALAVVLFLGLAAAALAFLLLVGLLALLIMILGLVVLVAILVGILVFGLMLILAIPYYFVTKPAESIPGTYGLDQVKEK